ncbi:RES family NAD+ phosphorylase [Algoriphagus iocasae]|nr:RES family NAD+ phosphorylase [Algoriphagus iocasae]
MEITDIIQGLRKLDLSTYPKSEIITLLGQVGPFAAVEIIYHKGKSLMRGRPNLPGERFDSKSDFSFKPQHLNKVYQRASTPERTMFYATAVPDEIQEGELNNMRIIGVFETIPMLRDKNASGYQKISFGRWVVQEDLRLLAIIHKEEYGKASAYLQELAMGYKRFSATVPKELQEKSFAFTSFLAEEFSKPEIRGDYDYMISALFSEMAIDKGMDGIFYPSVRVGGAGFNVAINPESLKKMGLYVAGECSVYKVREQVFVGNDAIVSLSGTEDNFTMKELENQEKFFLDKLGVRSVQELIDMGAEG